MKNGVLSVMLYLVLACLGPDIPWLPETRADIFKLLFCDKGMRRLKLLTYMAINNRNF